MSPTRPLDAMDRRILQVLQEDGRLSIARLAEHVGLSSTPCWNRVRTLEQRGVIKGYRAILDPAALGTPDTVLVEVSLSQHDDGTHERFARTIDHWTDVVEAYLVSGEFDYLLKVAVAGTAGHDAFLRRLHAFSGIKKSRSLFALRSLKASV